MYCKKEKKSVQKNAETCGIFVFSLLVVLNSLREMVQLTKNDVCVCDKPPHR